MPDSYAYFVVNDRRYDGLDSVPPSALLPLAVHLFQFPAEASDAEQVLRLTYDEEVLFPATPLNPDAEALAEWFTAEDVEALTGPAQDLPRHAPLFDRLCGALILAYELPDALPDPVRQKLTDLLKDDPREFYAEVERAAESGARALDAFDVIEYEWTHVAVRADASLETNVEVLDASEDDHDAPDASWSWTRVAGTEAMDVDDGHSPPSETDSDPDSDPDSDEEKEGWPYTSKWPDYEGQESVGVETEEGTDDDDASSATRRPDGDGEASAGEDIEFPDENPEDFEKEIESEHDYGASYDFSPDTPAPRADAPPSSARSQEEPHDVEAEITSDDTVEEAIEREDDVERVVEDDATVDRELTRRHSTPETYVFGPTRSLEEDIGPAISFDFGPQRDIDEIGPEPRPDRTPTDETFDQEAYASASLEGVDATVVSGGEAAATSEASAPERSRSDTEAADRRTCLFQIAVLAVALSVVAFAISQLL